MVVEPGLSNKSDEQVKKYTEEERWKNLELALTEHVVAVLRNWLKSSPQEAVIANRTMLMTMGLVEAALEEIKKDKLSRSVLHVLDKIEGINKLIKSGMSGNQMEKYMSDYPDRKTRIYEGYNDTIKHQLIETTRCYGGADNISRVEDVLWYALFRGVFDHLLKLSNQDYIKRNKSLFIDRILKVQAFVLRCYDLIESGLEVSELQLQDLISNMRLLTGGNPAGLKS